MILNFNINEEYGAKLDALATEGARSRRRQARKLVEDAIDMLCSDSLEEDEEDEKEAGA